jgi:hypothetical protein
VKIRRALLLFAVVLGVAALAASLSRSRNEQPAGEPAPAAAPETQSVPEASPGDAPPAQAVTPAGAPDTITFDAAADETRRLEAGRAASVEVAVDEPGLVAIPVLGLTGAADALTPARFDVLVSEEGRYPIEFAPSGGGGERGAGTLVVTPSSG